MENETCDKDNLNPVTRPSSETRLIKSLRIWQINPLAIVESGGTVHDEVCDHLEYFIGECMPYSPDKWLRGCWSDGVISLEIKQTGERSLNLLGVAYFGWNGNGLAPFEIDVELAPDSDRYFAKCMFRIGSLDSEGRLMKYDSDRKQEQILNSRPRENRYWAIAIELTPLSDRSTDPTG